MPTYQGETFLPLALESVSNQNFTNYELLIRDDGSKDRTLAIIESFKVPQFRLIKTPTIKPGLFSNLNALLKEAKAPLVQILCQDDVLEPDALKEISAYWDTHATIELLFTKHRMMDWEGNLGAMPSLTDLPDVLSSQLALQQFFFHGCIPSNLSTVSFRTRSAWALGGFNESLRVSGDYEFWVRLVNTGAMGILQKPLIRVRGHEGQLSRQTASGPYFVRENRAVRRFILDQFPMGLKTAAAGFEKKRHGVLDFHLALRTALKGEVKSAWAILCSLGIKDSLLAAFYWVTTANNHLRPSAPFQIPEEDKASQTPGDKAKRSS